MCFNHIGEWQAIRKNAAEPVCVVARKSTSEVMPLERAKVPAIERGKRRSQEQRRRRRPLPEGGLLGAARTVPRE